MLVHCIFYYPSTEKRPIRALDYLGSSRLNQGQLPRGCGAFYPRPGVVVLPKQLVFDSYMIEKCNFSILSGVGTFSCRGICLPFFLLQWVCSNLVSTREQMPGFFPKLLLFPFAFEKFACLFLLQKAGRRFGCFLIVHLLFCFFDGIFSVCIGFFRILASF